MYLILFTYSSFTSWSETDLIYLLAFVFAKSFHQYLTPWECLSRTFVKTCTECFQKKKVLPRQAEFLRSNIIKFMSSKQQFEQKNKNKTRFHQFFKSKLIENLFIFLGIAMYKQWNPNIWRVDERFHTVKQVR